MWQYSVVQHLSYISNADIMPTMEEFNVKMRRLTDSEKPAEV